MRSVISALGLVLLSACGCGDSNPFTPEEQVRNRAELQLLGVGAVLIGDADVVAECDVGLSPQAAYPGIAADAVWGSIVAFRVRNVRRFAPTAGLTSVDDVVFLHDKNFSEGFELTNGLWTLGTYAGATSPANDAEITCGDVEVTPSTAVRKLYQTLAVFEDRYGLNEEQAFDTIVEAQRKAEPFVATQESFLEPYGVADELLEEPTNWPPPPFDSDTQ